MRIELQATCCRITREPGDPRYHGTRRAAGESRLLYHVKKALNARGHDFVKVRMWKDGHLVAELQQYLRERKPAGGRQLAIYNDRWAIEGANDTLNREGEVELRVVDIGRLDP